jgi:hypothetical protein
VTSPFFLGYRIYAQITRHLFEALSELGESVTWLFLGLEAEVHHPFIELPDFKVDDIRDEE